MTPAQALDRVAYGQAYLIDLRYESEMRKAGIPTLPQKKKLIGVGGADIPDNLRRLLRDAKQVEYSITAVKIAALKVLNAKSEVILLDRNGAASSPSVARALSRLGFKNVYVVGGGFEAWRRTNLGYEGADLLNEVVTPFKLLGGAISRFWTS